METLRAGLVGRFGSAVALRGNAAAMLANNPEQTWRVGAFELTNEGCGTVIYSKLKLGKYVSPKGDGSRRAKEEAESASALEVLLDEVDDLLDDAREAAADG